MGPDEIAKPPKVTLVFNNIDFGGLLKGCTLGIDLLFFNVNDLVKGIKLITPGLHLLHYSLNLKAAEEYKATNNTLNFTDEVRYGYWFDSKENDVLIVQWNDDLKRLEFVHMLDETEQLNVTKCLNELGNLYPMMITYPENGNDWSHLTNFLNFDIVEDYISCLQPGITVELCSSSASYEENLEDIEITNQRVPLNSKNLINHDELRYTVIDLRKSAKDRDMNKVTNSFLNKTWYLREIYNGNKYLILAEVQLTFLNFILLGNFSSCLQWLKLLKLLLMCSSLLKTEMQYSFDFLKAFRSQLRVLPEEYLLDKNFDNNVIDVKSYTEIIENFNSDIFSLSYDEVLMKDESKNLWRSIIELHRDKFGLDFSKISTGMDENNMEVFDIEDYDEDDENAPAIA